MQTVYSHYQVSVVAWRDTALRMPPSVGCNVDLTGKLENVAILFVVHTSLYKALNS